MMLWNNNLVMLLLIYSEYIFDFNLYICKNKIYILYL